MTARRRPVPAPTAPAAPLVPLPTDWARERIRAATCAPWAWAGQPLPSYGSPDWFALAPDDPRRLAAALVAAEVCRYEAATLADRLRAELDQIATDHAIEDGARASMARDEALAAHARRVGERGARMLAGEYPTAEQLAERRGDPERAARARAQSRRIAALPLPPELMRQRV